MAGKPQNYLLTVWHAPSDRAPDGIGLNKSFLSPDTAVSWARDAYEAGATIVRVTRKTDGVIVYEPAEGIHLSHREW